VLQSQPFWRERPGTRKVTRTKYQQPKHQQPTAQIRKTPMNTYLGEDSLPHLTDDEFGAELVKARPYSVCILKAGPEFEPPTPDRRELVAQIIW
jgi:hypothetical protein